LVATARVGAALRHVGRLVPGEHRGGPLEIADLHEAAFEFRELVLGRAATALARGACGRTGEGCLGIVHRDTGPILARGWHRAADWSSMWGKERETLRSQMR